MKRFTALPSIIAIAGLLAVLFLPVRAFAIDPFGTACNTNITTQKTALCTDRGGQQLFGPGSIWNNLINLLLVVIGLIAVIMIIVGAIRYITANGEAKAISDAKNVILYAIVGIVVAIMAGAIVNFVLARL